MGEPGHTQTGTVPELRQLNANVNVESFYGTVCFGRFGRKKLFHRTETRGTSRRGDEVNRRGHRAWPRMLGGAYYNRSAAFAPIRTAEPRVPVEIRHKSYPAPHHYEPLLQPNGTQWNMIDLFGPKLNKSAAFAPIRIGPEPRVPSEIRHKPYPAPHDYTPLLRPNGSEWNMHDLNGAELNKSAAFAPICVAEPRVPREVRHRITPSPDQYRPITTHSGGRMMATHAAARLHALDSPVRTPVRHQQLEALRLNTPPSRSQSPTRLSRSPSPSHNDRRLVSPGSPPGSPSSSSPGRLRPLRPDVSRGSVRSLASRREEQRLQRTRLANARAAGEVTSTSTMLTPLRCYAPARWSDRVTPTLMYGRGYARLPGVSSWDPHMDSVDEDERIEAGRSGFGSRDMETLVHTQSAPSLRPHAIAEPHAPTLPMPEVRRRNSEVVWAPGFGRT